MQRTLCVGGVCKSMKELIYGCWYSPRASGMFNHVLEAERFEGVFFSKKSMLNSKIKLKKIGWYIKLLYATDYSRGELNLLTASKWRYPCI